MEGIVVKLFASILLFSFLAHSQSYDFIKVEFSDISRPGYEFQLHKTQTRVQIGKQEQVLKAKACHRKIFHNLLKEIAIQSKPYACQIKGTIVTNSLSQKKYLICKNLNLDKKFLKFVDCNF